MTGGVCKVAVGAIAALLVACGGASSETSYQPAVVEQFEMPIRVDGMSRTAVVEARLPRDYTREPSGGVLVSWYRRRDLGIYFRAFTSGWEHVSGTRDEEICGPELDPKRVDRPVVKHHLRERTGDGELALCEIEHVEDADGRRGTDSYLVRKWMPIGESWLECKIWLPGEESAPFRDASAWTARQRSDLLDVCRSFRVIRTEPYKPAPTPFDPPGR